MDAGTIQQALLVILNVVIAALVSALTALGVSYFRTRGQNLATKHDFDELQRQLKANTEIVETIKSEVSQLDWAQRERATLRRLKLEALLEKMHECEVSLDRRLDMAVEGKAAPPERDYLKELDAMATLYLPELKSDVDRFISTCKDERLLILKFGHVVINANAQNDPTAKEAAQKDFTNNWNLQLQVRRNARDALTAAARSLLERSYERG
jgi:hypothetical protein